MTKQQTSRLGFHVGEALFRVAGTYPTLLLTTLELVQNTIDANAKNIWVTLDWQKRHVVVCDNGNGVSRDGFEVCLTEVGKSQKTAGEMGRYGIGFISPLGKCAWYTFTSIPRQTPADGYTEWTFKARDIKQQADNVTVPCRSRPELAFMRRPNQQVERGKTGVLWRTRVEIFNFTEDKLVSQIASIDALRDEILERFSAAMRRKDVTLNITFIDKAGTVEERLGIRATEFVGRPLKEVTIKNDSVGSVVFRLLLAPKTTKGYTGNVVVGELELDSDYRFSLKSMLRGEGNLLSREVTDALLSGVFTGEILGELVTIHANRKHFDYDDAYVGLCEAIEEWFEQHGSQLLESEKESRREERYQELGLQSLKQIERMLSDPQYSHLQAVLDSFQIGNVGGGHAPRKNKAGVSEERSLSTHSGHENPRPDPTEDREPATQKVQPTEDIESHRPFTVAGRHGQRRKLVKRDSLGLQYSHTPMDGSDRLWELDAVRGILHFNINHPTWVACDDDITAKTASGRKVMQLMETVTVYALMCEAMPDEMKVIMREGFDETLPIMVGLYHNSPAFRFGRVSKTRKADKKKAA